jgi:hypothetical protein
VPERRSVSQRIKQSDVFVIVLARWLSKLSPLYIVGTVLVICLIIYAFARALR